MAYLLNVDQWDWVNPETQKVIRLRRGDEIPGEVLEQEGVDVESLTAPRARVPIFLDSGSDAGKRTEEARESSTDDTTVESARTSGAARSPSPKVAESK
jgi:hypothetical protein